MYSSHGPKTDRQFEVLLHEVAHQDRNLKGLAAVLRIPYSTLAEQLNPNIRDKKFHIGLLPGLIEAADDNSAIEYLAGQRGLIVITEPNPNGVGRRDWHQMLASSAKEGGEATAALARALANDGKVNRSEAPEVIREADEAIQVLLSIKHMAMEAMQD